MSHRKTTILVIESDPEVLELYQSYLSKRDYKVIAAADGAEGLVKSKEDPDVRLTILALELRNGMTGEEWLAWYALEGYKKPVIVASGKGDILTVTKENAFASAITKPFHMEELQELIEVLLADDWREQVSLDKKIH